MMIKNEYDANRALMQEAWRRNRSNVSFHRPTNAWTSRKPRVRWTFDDVMAGVIGLVLFFLLPLVMYLITK